MMTNSPKEKLILYNFVMLYCYFAGGYTENTACGSDSQITFLIQGAYSTNEVEFLV